MARNIMITNGFQTMAFENCRVVQIELKKLKNAKKVVRKLRMTGNYSEAQMIVDTVRKNSEEYYKYRIEINGKSAVYGLDKKSAMKIVDRINQLITIGVSVIDIRKVVATCTGNKENLFISGEFNELLADMYAGQTEY